MELCTHTPKCVFLGPSAATKAARKAAKAAKKAAKSEAKAVRKQSRREAAKQLSQPKNLEGMILTPPGTARDSHPPLRNQAHAAQQALQRAPGSYRHLVQDPPKMLTRCVKEAQKRGWKMVLGPLLEDLKIPLTGILPKTS
jgi:Sec-independent protein translocase protein TatA